MQPGEVDDIVGASLYANEVRFYVFFQQKIGLSGRGDATGGGLGNAAALPACRILMWPCL